MTTNHNQRTAERDALVGCPRVLVVVRGGVVQTVLSDAAVSCDVLDYDCWKECGDPLEEQARCYAELAAEIKRGEADGTFHHVW